MQFTTNYDLNKPDLTDKFKVEHQNQNMDIIDGEMKILDDATSFLATNLITNGNFANGTTGLTPYRVIITASNNKLRVVTNAATNTHFADIPKLSNFVPILNHKYYASATIENILTGKAYINILNRLSTGYYKTSPSDKIATNGRVSTILTTTSLHASPAMFVEVHLSDINGNISFTGTTEEATFSEIEFIDLTATFGTGKEPTKAQCDLMFATWKDATFQVSTIESLENNKANRVQEAWITPTLVNSWIPFDSATYNTFQYMKDEMGFVHLRGMVKSGTTGVICTLPAGYRPLKTVVNPCISNNVIGRVDINASGVVTCMVYNNTYVSLQGISFKAEL